MDEKVEPPKEPPPPPPDAPKARTDWRRVSRGLTWIGVGVFLLLNTTGQLRWSFWIDALFYWPVLLVALGLRLIFERSRTPWAVLASPALVLGTLAWVAAGHGSGPPSDWVPLRATLPAETRRFTLDAGLFGAEVDLRAGPVGEGLLVEGRAASWREPRLRVSDGESCRVRLGRRHGSFEIAVPWRRERWDLTLMPGLPMTLDLGGAASGGTLDLRQAVVERVLLEGAVNGFHLLLDRPERDVRVDLEGAFNVLRLTVPEGVPVEIRKDGFLNLHRRRTGDTTRGPGYVVRVEGAFNRIKVGSGP